MADRIGLFGSNVGSYAAQKKKPDLGIPGVTPPKPRAPSFAQPRSWHPSVQSVPSSLLGVSSSSQHIAAPFSYDVAGASGSGGGGLLGDIAGGVEGFIGHLGTDIVHTALGLPVGLAYMVEHPIAGVEAAAKATWNDWSPLFHGDVRLWLHNTYEHPLAPILDVASVMTGGAAIAARTADVVASVGVASEALAAGTGTESALMAGAKTAIGAGGRTEAFRAAATAGSTASATKTALTLARKAGMDAGQASLKPTTLYEKLQQFANPARYAHQSYMKIAAKLGYTTQEEIHAYADMALQFDQNARRIYRTATGRTTWKDLSNNPWTRTRQASLRKLSNKLADKSPHLAEHIGDKAHLRRWSGTDAGQRAAAVADTIHKEFATWSNAGKAIDSLHAHEAADFMHGHMRNGIVQQGHAITPDANYVSQIDGATGKAAQARDITRSIANGGEGVKFVTNESHYAEKNGALMERMAQQQLKGVARDKILHEYLKDGWKTASVTNNVEHAMVDANGNWITTGAADSIAKETAFSSKLAHTLYTKPTQVWKYLLLGLSPRYFVNNFVGNSIMLMAATDPVSLARAFHGYMHARGLAKEFERTTNDTLAQLGTKAGATQQKIDVIQSHLDKAVDEHNRLSTPPRRARKGDTAHQKNQTRSSQASFKANNSPDKVAARQANITGLRRSLADNRSIMKNHDARIAYYQRKAALVKGGLVGQHWMDKWFAGEYGMGRTMQIEGENDGGIVGKLNTKYSLHGVTHRWADMPQRYMALNYSMKRMPEFQAEYARLRAGGMDHIHAEAKAADKAAQSGAVRQLVRNQVNHMFGQYHSFTKTEQAVKQVVPFYAWDRAIATHMKYLITNQPYKVAMGASIGSLGNMKTRQMMGQVPDFMMSIIPAKILGGPLGAIIGNSPGRLAGLNAYGLNPYSSVSDITGMALAATGQGKFRVGDSLGGQLNPLIQQAAQELSGTNLQTGAPMKTGAGGPLAQLYIGTYGSVPQLTLLKNLLGYEDSSVTKAGNQTLYKKGVQATLSGLLGAPVKQVNLDTAHAMFKLQNPGPKKSRKKAYNVPGF